jgi:outer membrane autotransporter protein
MGAVYADNGSVVTVGSTSPRYTAIKAEGEVLAEDNSTASLYADEIAISKTNNDAAVSAVNGSTVDIGDSSTTSITTTGEVLATDGDDEESADDDDNTSSSITLTAANITMNYSPNLSETTGYGGGEDHTLYADGGSKITVSATGSVDIEGPIGAVDSDSSITIDGTAVSITHNTVGTGDYTLETRGIHVEDGASIQIGSDDTDTLTINVGNDSGDSTIVVSGNDSTLNLYGKTISITTTDGILNGNIKSDNSLETEYAGGKLNIGSDNTSSLTINGILRTVGDGANTTLLGSSITATDYVAAYHDGTTTIGSESTDSVTLEETGAFYNSSMTILGDSITFNAESTDGETTDAISIYVNYGSTVTVGSDTTSKVTVGGSVDVNRSNLTIKGNEIEIGTTGTLDLEFSQVGEGTVTIGDDTTKSVAIDNMVSLQASTTGSNTRATITGDTVTLGGIVDVYGTGAALTVDGTDISLTLSESYASELSDAMRAFYGGSISLGSSRTESLTVSGQVTSRSSFVYNNITYAEDTAVSLDGNTITLENGALATGSGASITIGDAGVTETLSGDLTATDGGVITATLSGAYTGDATASDAGTLTLTTGSATGTLTATGSGSTLTADVSGTLTGNATATDSGTLILTTDSVVGNLSTSDSGTLTATVSNTFTGTTTDDADTMTLNMESGSTWNLTDSSTVSTLDADGANINLLNGTLGQTLTTDTFEGDGTTVYLDADGSTNTGNDRLYVTGTHTGTTSLHLASTSDTWSGALGTVLVSVGDEQGSFVSDGETEAALYYYDLVLASTTDNVTDGYGTDWYLKGFTKESTNSEGHHTTVVRNLGGITGSNYLLWRSDMDTLFRRLGETDNSLTENTDDGVWVRAKGKKFSRVSDFLVDTKYNEYEVGYDWLHDKTDKNEHVAGVGIAYLDGDSTYVTGKGDLTGYTLGFYDTTVWKDGQYLDLVLKGSRYKNEFSYRALGRYIDGKSDSTGLSLGAEYGYKRKAKSGWYVEPQAQFVLGYFRNNDFTDSNGVHVDNETIRTAIGRIGLRAGYEDKKLSAYAKANWYHDFGGNHVTTMSVGTDSLRIHEDYGDTWFAYGLGAAYKMNNTAQLYLDLERGDGSTYDENWSWDAGVKFSF